MPGQVIKREPQNQSELSDHIDFLHKYMDSPFKAPILSVAALDR